MDSLSVYIPMDRRLSLVHNQPLPDRSHGAALFADISGFTPLTAALAKELGPQRGAEEIIRHLNRVYEALISEIHRYGGSVIGFSGDGLTCWLDGDNGRRATACALALQTVMTAFSEVRTPAGSRVSLALKAAVTAGAARRFLVGLPDIQRLEVLAGNTLTRLGMAESLARQSEIIVGAEVMAWFGDQLQIEEWRAADSGEHFAVINSISQPVAPAPWSESPAVNDATTSEWLLPPVFERLQRGEGDFLAQLRPSVALFLKFGNIDYDYDKEAGLKLDAYTRWVQRILDTYQGYLLQLTIGEKGSYMYAAFGAPISHEDDAARAVAAALDLQSPPRGLSFNRDVQIGISQGLVRMGAYGGLARRTYGAQGSEVNMAARLMAQAKPGQIIVSQHIVAATEAYYTYQPLGNASLKGIKDPIPLYAAQGKRYSQATGPLDALSRQQMVGREQELQHLQERLQTLHDEKIGSAILIEGDAGIGKSRLVAALLQQAQALGVTPLLGAGNAIEQTTAYHAWRPVFRELLGIEALEDSEAIWQQAMAFLAEEPRLFDRIPLLNDILPLNLLESDFTEQLYGELRAMNTRAFLVRLLSMATKRAPRLLVLEDAHWLDSASWALVSHVKREVPALMLVLVTRPLLAQEMNRPVPVEYERLRRDDDLDTIQLTLLPAVEATKLVCHRLGVEQLPEPVVNLIQERAEGHPFFSEELAYALRDTGLIQVRNGRCQLTTEPSNLQQLEFPDTIQQVITNRIDRLTPAQQLTLKVASVIGRIFAYYTLSAIHPVEADKPHLPEHLETLTTLDITHVETAAPEPTYIFKHTITQEVAYNLLLFAQRRALHQAVAIWYEQTYAGDLSACYPVLAHHWRQAEVHDNAIYYLEQAGKQALRHGAYREATSFFEQLLKVHDQISGPAESWTDDQRLQRARWQRLLADALWGIGDIPRCMARAQQVLKLLNAEEPKTQLGVMSNFIFQFSRQLLHLIWPSQFLGRRQLTPRQEELGHVFRMIAQIYFLNNQFWRCYSLGCQYINLVESLAIRPSALAEAYANTSLGMGSIRVHLLAERYGRQAEALAQNIDTLSTKAFVQFRLGIYRSGLGHWQEAHTALAKATQINQTLGDWRSLGDGWHALGYTYFFQGEFEKAGETGHKEYELATRQGNVQQQAWALHLQAIYHLQMGESDQTIAQAKKALALLDQREEIVSQSANWAALALGYLHCGSYEEAQEAAAKVTQILGRSLPIVVYLFFSYIALPQTYLTLWEFKSPSTYSKWLQPAHDACRALHRYARAFPIGRPRAWLYQGIYEWQQGKQRQAHKAWQKSLALAQELQMPYDVGLAHYEIGRHLPVDDSRRPYHLNQAQTRFTRLGALYDLKRCKEVHNMTAPRNHIGHVD